MDRPIQADSLALSPWACVSAPCCMWTGHRGAAAGDRAPSARLRGRGPHLLPAKRTRLGVRNGTLGTIAAIGGAGDDARLAVRLDRADRASGTATGCAALEQGKLRIARGADRARRPRARQGHHARLRRQRGRGARRLRRTPRAFSACAGERDRGRPDRAAGAGAGAGAAFRDDRSIRRGAGGAVDGKKSCTDGGSSRAAFVCAKSQLSAITNKTCQRRSDFRPAWRRNSRPVTSGTGAMQRAPIGALCIASASVGVRRE